MASTVNLKTDKYMLTAGTLERGHSIEQKKASYNCQIPKGIETLCYKILIVYVSMY